MAIKKPNIVARIMAISDKKIVLSKVTTIASIYIDLGV
jgi:hypothetical protein